MAAGRALTATQEAHDTALVKLTQAISSLRDAGVDACLCRGLLARAELLCATGSVAAARADHGEAQRIAARGEMALLLVDCELQAAAT